MEAAHRRAVQQLRARLGAIHAEIAARGEGLENVEAAARLHATAFQELENYARNLEQLNAALQQERQHLEVSARRFSEIEASTTWRATAVLRRAGSVLPRSIRRSLRRSAKAVYWLLTLHRLPDRVRFLRERGRLPPVVSPRTNTEPAENSAPSGTPEPSAASHDSTKVPTAPLAIRVTPEPSAAGDDSDQVPTVPLAAVVTEASHLAVSDREIGGPELAVEDSVASDREQMTNLDRKGQFASDARALFEAFVASGHRLSLPTSEDPELSILLVLYNQAPLSYLCLRW